MTRCFKLYTIYCAVVKKFELCGSLFRDFTNIYVKIICGMLSETAPGYSTVLYSSLFYDRIQFIKLRESSECSLEQNPLTNRIFICSLCDKCPDTEFFLVRIFPYSDWIRENTDQKNLRIWTLFTQWLCSDYALLLLLYVVIVPLRICTRYKLMQGEGRIEVGLLSSKIK